MKARFLWRAYRARYRDQVAELSTIERHIRDGDTVCDIGANKGAYTYWLSRWVGSGHVIAFEPQQRLAQYLTRACTALALGNVTVEAKAVHARTGSTTLHIPTARGDSPGASLSARVVDGDGGRAVPVRVVALDDYFAPRQRIAVLKIDVEGAEIGVFEGATRILTEQAPLVVFECENRHLESGTVWDAFRYLGALGYSGEFVHGRALRPLSDFDPSIHQKQTGHRFWAASGYCNNFVFRQRA